MKNEDKSVRLVRIKNTKEHIDALYALLKSRKFNISNHRIPSYAEHKLFVMNNPYRAWYLIEVNKKYTGTVYLLKDNCVGIYAGEKNADVIKYVIRWILKNKSPLPGIKSVRPSNFFINLAPANKYMSLILKKMGATPIQVTYTLKDL